MEQAAIILGFVVIVALIAIGGYYAHKAAQKRRDELRALAAELGWSFDPAEDRAHDKRYRFPAFQQGHSRAAYNTLAGDLVVDGRRFPARMGDYTYKITQHTGKTTTTVTYRLSYLIVHAPFPGLPDLLIRRENLLDKLAGALGFDDIDFESSEFSRAFHVKCPDKKLAYDIVHPRMMEFLMASDPPAIDVRAGVLCLTEGTKVWPAAEFRGRLAWAAAFFDLWPDYLTSQLGAGNTQ